MSDQEGDVVKFADHLSKETIKKFNEIRNAPEQQEQLPKPPKPNQKKPINKPKANRKKEESLSFKDIEELMGTRRDTYSRVRGAVRRK
jgi:hypothetical protein